MLLLAASFAFAGLWTHDPEEFTTPFEALIVPGCPVDADGFVSTCQWRRASWAAELFHAGAVENLVVSGAAVYTPYAEAEGLRAALLTLGVPDERIVLELQARHTDQNAAFSLLLCQERGWEDLAVASDGLHAVMIDMMLSEWGAQAFAIPVTEYRIAPTPRIPVAPSVGWRPPEELDAERPSPSRSLPTYLRKLLSAPFVQHRPPELP